MSRGNSVRNIAVFIVSVILALSALGTGAAIAAPYKAEKVAEKLIVDGIDNGYAATALTLGKGSVKMAFWQDRVFVLASMKGSGWIAVAFNKQGKGMDGSNMIIGYLDAAGKAAVRNDLGKGWSHSAAAKQAVIEHAIVQSDGITYFEFVIPAFVCGRVCAQRLGGRLHLLTGAGRE